MTTSYFDLDKRRRDEMIRATLDKIELSPFAKELLERADAESYGTPFTKTELPPFYRSGRAPKVPKVPRAPLVPKPIDVGFKPDGGPICFRCFLESGGHYEVVVLVKTVLEVALTWDGTEWIDAGMVHDNVEVQIRCPKCHAYNSNTGWLFSPREGGPIIGKYELVRAPNY